MHNFETNQSIQADIDKPSQSKPWFRVERQLRFTRQEQHLLHRLVKREAALYWVEWEKVQATDNDDVRRKAVAKMVESAGTRYLKVLYREFGNPRLDMIGQAYDGKSFAMKRKCPFCTNLYIFLAGQESSIKENKWLVNIGDLGRGYDDPRGFCAEALVFVLCLGERGLNIVREVLDFLIRNGVRKNTLMLEHTRNEYFKPEELR